MTRRRPRSILSASSVALALGLVGLVAPTAAAEPDREVCLSTSPVYAAAALERPALSASSATAGGAVQLSFSVSCPSGEAYSPAPVAVTVAQRQAEGDYVSRVLTTATPTRVSGDAQRASYSATLTLPDSGDESALPAGEVFITRIKVSLDRADSTPGYSQTLESSVPAFAAAKGLRFTATSPVAAPAPRLPVTVDRNAAVPIRMGAWFTDRLSYAWKRADTGEVLSTEKTWVPSSSSASGPVTLTVTATTPDGATITRTSAPADVSGRSSWETLSYDVAPTARARTSALDNGAAPLTDYSGSGSGPKGGWYEVLADGRIVADVVRGTHWRDFGPADIGRTFFYSQRGPGNYLSFDEYWPRTEAATVAATPAPNGAGLKYTLNRVAQTGTAFGARLSIGSEVATFDPFLSRYGVGEAATVRWYRNGQAISGATKSDYVLTRADSNATLQARWTATTAGWRPAVSSLSTIKVAKFPLASAVPGHATRKVLVGQKLTASTNGWTSGATFTYRWLRNGKPISGATKSSYTVTAADYRAGTVSLRVTGSHPNFTSVSRTSQPTQLINRGKLVVGGAKLSSVPKVGKKVSVTRTGTWTSGVSYRYQWTKNGRDIKGATKSSYTPKRSDRGAKLGFRIAASKDGYVSSGRTAAAQRVR